MPKIFRKVGDPKKLEIKLAPQEAIILGCIPGTKAGIERKELVAKLDALTTGDDPTLMTRQPTARLLAYYQRHLVDSKLVEVETIKVEPKKKEPAKEEAKAA